MKKHWILLTLAVLGAGCASMQHHDDAEENEVKMTLDQVPAPVRAGLMREANGATIKTVDREEENGKTIYETDIMSGGKNWEIKVDEKGNLLSKEVDDDEEMKPTMK